MTHPHIDVSLTILMTKYRDKVENLKGFVSCFLQMLRGYQDGVIPTFAIAVATRLQRSTTPLGILNLSTSLIFQPLAKFVTRSTKMPLLVMNIALNIMD